MLRNCASEVPSLVVRRGLSACIDGACAEDSLNRLSERASLLPTEWWPRLLVASSVAFDRSPAKGQHIGSRLVAFVIQQGRRTLAAQAVWSHEL